MPDFVGRMFDAPLVHAQFTGGGFWTGRMFPESLPAVDPVLTVLGPIGGQIGTQTPWQARLTLLPTDGTIARIIIDVAYPNGVFESAYLDTGKPNPDYSGKSSVVQTSPGVYDISIIRNGGWPSSPRVFLHAHTNRGGMTR